MSRQAYTTKKFKPETMELIATMNEIVDEYVEQGFRLTVRQLYYQMVARGFIENTERSYGKICSVVNDAKLAGYMDWDAIEDRTRAFIRRSRWASGKSVLESAAASFHMDMWAGQKHRVFCIVEKEALAGVLEGPCNNLDIPLLAARGYPSGTVLREFAVSDLIPCFAVKDVNNKWRILTKDDPRRQIPILLHLGDHDPSGIDMTRDLSERLATFLTGEKKDGYDLGDMFKRIALNMDQIEEQRPPENPAKTTDSRFESYEALYGDKSWELDALNPTYLAELVRDNAREHIDNKVWNSRLKEIEEVRKRITKLASEFE